MLNFLGKLAEAIMVISIFFALVWGMWAWALVLDSLVLGVGQ
jgi:hypothetical protein